MTHLPIVNIAAYKFINLNDVLELQVRLRRYCLQQKILGTILLGNEGINIMLAGSEIAIEGFINHLNSDERFQDMAFKKSYSASLPFSKLVVKIKNEIIRMDKPDIEPQRATAPYITPEHLKTWLDKDADVVLLDTRNAYETEVGTFNKAVHLNIDDFRTFPQACAQLTEEHKNKPIVTFCTGGIRCEKASAYLLQQGFTQVYQLEGGILNYFARCEDAHWEGECFVFDNRVSLNSNLQETDNFKHLVNKSSA